MKTVLLMSLAAAGIAGGLTLVPCGLVGGSTCGDAGWSCDEAPATPRVTSQLVDLGPDVAGDYVEARSASVFAGACHTGSESASQGRQALMAWAIETGSHAGRDLTGVRIAAAVSGADNLDRCGERTSVVFIDAPDRATELAARGWLEDAHGDALGNIAAVESERVSFERSGQAFVVRVADTLELAGEAIADGSCCTMKEERYYEPLAADAGAIVGVPSDCRFAGFGELPAWRFEDANSAFVTTFARPAAVPVSYAGESNNCDATLRACDALPPSCETKRSSCTPKPACGIDA